MPTRSSYDYAYLRVVPRVQTGEFLNVGVILYCRTLRYLGLRLVYMPQQLAAFVAPLSLHAVQEQLAIIEAIGRGEGPIGALGQAEIFHWLVAPHSTVMQASPVHSGLCTDPEVTLGALAEGLRRPMAVDVRQSTL
jgi:hypothetical protein